MDLHLIQTLTEALQQVGQQPGTSIVVQETIRIQPFRGLDGDDVVEWLEVFESHLKRRRIALDSEGVLTEMVLHLARHQTNGNYPFCSGYDQTQRQNDLPSFNPRNPHVAVLDENFVYSFVTLLEQNTNNRQFQKRQVSKNKLEQCWLAHWQRTSPAANKYISLGSKSTLPQTSVYKPHL